MRFFLRKPSYRASCRAEIVNIHWTWALAALVILAGCQEAGPKLEPTTHVTGEASDGSPISTPGAFGSELIDTGFGGAEPTIGIDAQGALFVAAFDHVIKSTDAGLR